MRKDHQVIQWLRDGLHLLPSAKDSEKMAQAAREQQVYFVPAFTGLGAPYWNPHARGAIFGLTRDTQQNEIVAAALDSVCFQTMDLLTAMQQDGAIFKELRTALGAAYLAGLQTGVWQSLDEIASLWQEDRSFRVEKDSDWAKQRYHGWQAAVKGCQVFSEGIANR